MINTKTRCGKARRRTLDNSRSIYRFAEDTKLCRAVGDDQEADILWEDLRSMFRWSQDWQMLFNLEKCSVMHMGKRNQELSYEMGGKVLKVSEEERDLGVIMHRS